jgi:hypothetical protein
MDQKHIIRRHSGAAQPNPEPINTAGCEEKSAVSALDQVNIVVTGSGFRALPCPGMAAGIRART